MILFHEAQARSSSKRRAGAHLHYMCQAAEGILKTFLMVTVDVWKLLGADVEDDLMELQREHVDHPIRITSKMNLFGVSLARRHFLPTSSKNPRLFFFC